MNAVTIATVLGVVSPVSLEVVLHLLENAILTMDNKGAWVVMSVVKKVHVLLVLFRREIKTQKREVVRIHAML